MHNYSLVLSHSAKGSEWKDHKYVRKVDGTYYYLDANGNETTTTHKNDTTATTSSDKKEEKKDDKSTTTSKTNPELTNITATDLSDENIDKLAKEVIKGSFGNGQVRKDILGDNYTIIQKRVNELMKSIGSKTLKDMETSTSKKKKSTSKKSKSSTSSKRTSSTTKKSTVSNKKTSKDNSTAKVIDDSIKHDTMIGENYLMHFGNKNSGRYPRGSGERPHQHDGLGGHYSGIDRQREEVLTPGGKIGGGKKSDIQKSCKKAKKVDREDMSNYLFEQNIKGGKDKPNQNRLEKGVKDTDKIVRGAQDARRDYRNAKNRVEREKIVKKEADRVSNMSDQELKEFVNRRNLEKQYMNALVDEQLDSGYSKIDNILDLTGDIVGITGGVIGIATGIHYLRHH